MFLNILEGGEQAGAKLFNRIEIAVMSDMLSCIAPKLFGRIVLRAIAGQQKDLYLFTIFFEPIINLRLLVISGVVMNKIDAAVSFIQFRQKNLVEEINIGFSVETFFLMPVYEKAAVKANRAENLLCVALSEGWNLRLRI